MAINHICKNCKTNFSLSHKKCPKCGAPIPRVGKMYRVRVQVNGKRITRTIPNSLELAKEIEAKLKTELISGDYYDRRKKIPKLDEIWEKYFEAYQTAGKSPSKEKNRYDTLIKPRLGKKALDAISVMDIQRLVIDMKKTKTKRGTPYSIKSIRNTTELISRLYNFAKRQSLYDGDNPVEKATLPKVNNEVVRYLTEQQITELLFFLDSYHNKEVANIVKFLLFTGTRRGEAFKLKWSDIDFERNIMRLKDPKGGRDEYVPLNSMAVSVLNNQRQYKRKETDLVFPSNNNTVRSDINSHWRKIKKAVNLPVDFRLHDLRHTFASLLASSGKVDLYTLQKLMTHKSPQMTQRYAHLIDSSLRQGVEVLGDMIDIGNSKVVSIAQAKRKE